LVSLGSAVWSHSRSPVGILPERRLAWDHGRPVAAGRLGAWPTGLGSPAFLRGDAACSMCALYMAAVALPALVPMNHCFGPVGGPTRCPRFALFGGSEAKPRDGSRRRRGLRVLWRTRPPIEEMQSGLSQPLCHQSPPVSRKSTTGSAFPRAVLSISPLGGRGVRPFGASFPTCGLKTRAFVCRASICRYRVLPTVAGQRFWRSGVWGVGVGVGGWGWVVGVGGCW